MVFYNRKFRLSKRQLLAAGSFLVFGSSLNVTKPLSPRQEAIILGNILGDGHLQLSPNGKTTRLRFNHSMSQCQYVTWQYKELDWLCKGVSPPKEIFEHQKYRTCRAYTAYHPELTSYHTLTYKKNFYSRKKVYKNSTREFF